MSSDMAFGAETGGRPAYSRRGLAVAAGAAGNVLEWYDFSVYAFLIPVLSRAFFPTSEPMTGTLVSLAVLGSGFVMRPLGAVVFSIYGDRAGRRAALTWIMSLMGLTTFAIGLLPTYHDIGLGAPLALVVLRLIQGLSSGGEWGGAATFVVEHAQQRRGLYGALHVAGISVGFILGSGTVTALTGAIGQDAMAAWGWRIPFLLGISVMLVGLYLRRAVPETPSFEALKAKQAVSERPLTEALTQYKSVILTIFLVSINFATTTWLTTIYIPTYLITIVHLPPASALQISTIGLLVSTPFLVLCGWLSDKFGRKPFLIAGSTTLIVAALPMFHLMQQGSYVHGLIAQIVLLLCTGLVTGSYTALVMELLPTRVRFTGFSTAYNLAQAIFGGFAPFAAQYLIAATGSSVAPAYLLMAGPIISLGAILMVKETAFEALE
ncbi:MFS transporter [Bradyrhizobium sp. ma5]|uniref:MFS transporter n=1 Tax=Bradyrhizobium sp. ma5 TaxID=3344828 RepID=UPI0035D4E1DC